MIQRRFWLERLEALWRSKSVIWLSGVRRSGKTVLCQSLPDDQFFDCELPRMRRELADPESFLHGLRGQRVVLDEIHRLGNPSELLKIAADHYRDVRHWRDKRGHEVDFVWVRRGRPPLGIECKWSADQYSPEGAQAFARAYPKAEMVVVAQDVQRPCRRKFGATEFEFLSLPGLIQRMSA